LRNNVGVTELGRRFLAQAQPGLASLALTIEGLNESRDKPSGTLRLNLSRTAADIVVMPHLSEFFNAFPEITLEMHCDNALLDIVAGGFDAGIRLGENLAQDVVAVPLAGRHRIATVASPRYLAGRTLPRVPQDLVDHRCLQCPNRGPDLPLGILAQGPRRRDRRARSAAHERW
jgi:DNA-binding transcriptional LysR family regulator